ncbi:hypothetical protein E4U55_004977 [Claviceps digitariae]|nr:hypothetical protein E4U55_004977 [Claviceps digitariae]
MSTGWDKINATLTMTDRGAERDGTETWNALPCTMRLSGKSSTQRRRSLQTVASLERAQTDVRGSHSPHTYTTYKPHRQTRRRNPDCMNDPSGPSADANINDATEADRRHPQPRLGPFPADRTDVHNTDAEQTREVQALPSTHKRGCQVWRPAGES